MEIFLIIWLAVAGVVGRESYKDIKSEYKHDYHVEIYCTPTNDPCMEIKLTNVTKRNAYRTTSKVINKLWEAGMIDPLTTVYASLTEVPKE